MGNIIRLHAEHKNADEWISMSNGSTSVFISVLVLSGSRIAKTEREKELVIWIAEQDQAVVGSGTVGFNISDMPWTKENFIAEREFILKVVEGSKLQQGWETLDYLPDKVFITGCLDAFINLVMRFDEKFIEESNYMEWINERDGEFGIPVGFPKCAKHNAYMHWQGCVICNDTVNL